MPDWLLIAIVIALALSIWVFGIVCAVVEWRRERRRKRELTAIRRELARDQHADVAEVTKTTGAGTKTHREAELERLNAEADAEAERLFGIYKARDDAEAEDARTWVPPLSVDTRGVLPMIEYDGKRIAGAHIVSVEVEKGGRSPEKEDFTDDDYEEKYDGWLKRAREIDYTQTTILVRTIAGSVTAFWISHHKADALLSALIEARDRCLRIWLQRGHTDPVWRVVSGEKRGTVPGEW